MIEKRTVVTKLYNYYGRVEFVETNKGCFMMLDDHNDTNTLKISREFFEAAIKEFSPKESTEENK